MILTNERVKFILLTSEKQMCLVKIHQMSKRKKHSLSSFSQKEDPGKARIRDKEGSRVKKNIEN